MSPAIYAKFGSFSITYPERSPIHPTSQDSGIFVIRNMQFYRQRWYQGFNSGDQRVRLALEIVNHPMNDMAELVWQAAAEEVPNAVAAEGGVSASVNACGVVAVAGMKFKPRRARR
ncbi:uncharacterized protein LOC133709221 [Rosa rugosa]|uniref:uncharacterized protein LOC133709221 n=1 Tax=Rosa rugosa TaxID=74645 RepID=UPI002B4156F9|nr:uncharacterized protein LOC133709221 [Rosa rugosa]